MNMSRFCLYQLSCVFFAALLNLSFADDARQVYIVYMGQAQKDRYSISSDHFDILEDVLESGAAEDSLVRSYTRTINGFAANLTAKEIEKLTNRGDVVAIIPNLEYELVTTRSWDFTGLPEDVRRNPTVESNTIIGVIDSGIWPESESFNDKGFGPPPNKWKGACRGGANFTCNNKLIGARYYGGKPPLDNSALDLKGHGTHTASTAAGNPVRDASFNGIAKGTARGGVPSARIAAYKACNFEGCSSANILAAFDDAIADRVDIISISIASKVPKGLQTDVIAIGSFHASQRGILVVQAAGNYGPEKGSVSSVVPWVLTVAGSSTDRAIYNKVVLPNGTFLIGRAVNPFNLVGSKTELKFGRDVSRNCNYGAALACKTGCLDRDLVRGKIVLCSEPIGDVEAIKNEAAGVITTLAAEFSQVVSIPESNLDPKDFTNLVKYFNSTRSIRHVEILASETIRTSNGPWVALFSSRGPNTIIPDLLKPDLTAPGVEILAAFSPFASWAAPPSDKRGSKYNVLSGTSMSCPHVAGAAAYVKTFHPDWSPAVIKSALMTTAKRMNTSNDALRDSLAEFSYGAGHINPTKALDPGLVYDTPTRHYIKMLCNMGYNTSTLVKIFSNGVNANCPAKLHSPIKDLNYPSMSAQVPINKGSEMITSFSKRFRRTVMNVGPANSTYRVTTTKGKDYSISVDPNALTFVALNEKKKYVAIISGKMDGKKTISAGLEWSDGVRKVWSPIVIYPNSV